MCQENRVIAYASKALSPTEQRYSQTEREALSIVWSIEHFHLYLFGHTFTLITDHNPLVAIFNNPKAKQPLRLERWRLRLATYNFTVKYCAGKENIADYLSRHPRVCEITDNSVAEDYCCYIAYNAVPKSMSLSEIASAVLTDKTLQQVITSVKTNKWDKSECKANTAYSTYARLKDELTVTVIKGQDILLRGTKLAIPTYYSKR